MALAANAQHEAGRRNLVIGSPMTNNGAWMWFLVLRKDDRAPEVWPWCGGYSKKRAMEMLNGVLEEQDRMKLGDLKKTGLSLERLFVALPDEVKE